MTSRPSETLAYHLHPTSCPEEEEFAFYTLLYKGL